MSKKFTLILITICLLLGAFPATAAAAEAASNTYTVNGVDVRWDDFSSRPNNCRVYAENMYQKIWGTDFSYYFNDDDNYLRELENEALTLTEEHLKEYVSGAALGSTIRVSSLRFLHRNDGNQGHSQIIVQKDENGFTVLEGGLSAYPYCAENYYTWSDFVNARWLGGKYEYIKYIKWPGASVYGENTGEETPEVSIPVVELQTARTAGTGSFRISYTATDDLGVVYAYVRVWAQGLTEEEGTTYYCDLEGDTAAAVINCDISGKVRNYYYRWYAVDANGNVAGLDQEPRLVSFYIPQVECLGFCTVTTADTAVCSAPYDEINGVETVQYRASEGSKLSICGIYRNDDGARWYALKNGMWVSEAYVRYDTLTSLIEWIYTSCETKDIIYIDGQVLFVGE